MKTVSESSLETTYMVMPEHTNPLGNVFGGTIMAWIDVTAGIVAFRHCRSVVVTASMDELHFLNPIKAGDLVTLKASVNYTGHRSLEVGVKVVAENALTGHSKHTASAYLTFVSLTKDGNVVPVPKINPQTPDEKRRFIEGEERKQQRLNNKKRLLKKDVV